LPACPLHSPSGSSRPHSCFSHAPATTAISTLSLHDALPISDRESSLDHRGAAYAGDGAGRSAAAHRILAKRQGTPAGGAGPLLRSEEHTSELQSRENLVCRLLLEKKKYTDADIQYSINACTT